MEEAVDLFKDYDFSRMELKLVGKKASKEKKKIIEYQTKKLGIPYDVAVKSANQWIESANEVAKEFGETIEEK